MTRTAPAGRTLRFITALSARLTCPKPNARPIRHNGQVPDRNGKIFYTSITSLSHISKSSGDVSKESLKNNIGLKFAFRSTDTNEIKQTLEFFGLDSEDENNQKRLRDLENGQCLMQDLYGRVGVVQIHPVFVELLHAFDTRPPIKSEVDLE